MAIKIILLASIIGTTISGIVILIIGRSKLLKLTFNKVYKLFSSVHSTLVPIVLITLFVHLGYNIGVQFGGKLKTKNLYAVSIIGTIISAILFFVMQGGTGIWGSICVFSFFIGLVLQTVLRPIDH